MKSMYLVPLFIFSCSDSGKTGLPENMEDRKLLYRQIVNDEEKMQEFMNEAMDSENGRRYMGNHQSEEDRLENREQESMGFDNYIDEDSLQAVRMLQLCLRDTSYCSMMSGLMMGNKPMMRNMMNQMHREGMLSEDCLENGRKKMK